MSDSAADTNTDTDYEIGQHNIQPFGLDIHNPVFLVSGLSIIAFVIITLMFQQEATAFLAGCGRFLPRHLTGFSSVLQICLFSSD